MGHYIEIKTDKNGLKEVLWHGSKGKELVTERGPLDEEHKDIIVDMIPVGLLVKILRKANIHVVCVQSYQPGD